MITLALLLAGCNSMPDTIPGTPGEVSESNLALVTTAAVPDAPYLLWLAIKTLSEDTYRDCPQITTQASSTSIVAKGCQDAGQLTWDGAVTLTSRGSSDILTFNDLSVSGSGLTGAWSVDGTMTATRLEDYSSYRFDTALAIHSPAYEADNGDGDTTEAETDVDFWINTETAYSQDNSDFEYADNWEGEIGVSAIGVFDVKGAGTEVAAVTECGFGHAGFGQIAVAGQNRADLDFYALASTDGPTPPPVYYGGDSGWETGDTSDSGDTADSGDSGDTADTSDTGGGSDTVESVCGCARAKIGAATDGSDAVEVASCLVPSRSVAWPFIALY